MLKLLFVATLCLAFTYANAQRIIQQDYDFIGRGQLVTRIHQSNDTLYLLRCFPLNEVKPSCLAKPEAHYKILAFSKQAEFYVVKVERLDSIALTTKPYPETRYSLLVLANVTDKKLGYLAIRPGSTRSQIDTAKLSNEYLRGAFYFTYLSQAYLKQLSALKPIATKQQADEITEYLKDSAFKDTIEKYKKTNPADFYASGLVLEIITAACIQKNYNPVNAFQLLNTLLK